MPRREVSLRTRFTSEGAGGTRKVTQGGLLTHEQDYALGTTAAARGYSAAGRGARAQRHERCNETGCPSARQENAVSKKKTARKTTPPTGSELRGGTQTGTAPVVQPGNSPGGTNALTPSGGSHQGGRVKEPPTGDKSAAERQDPERALSDDRTTQSADVIAQRAREDATAEGSSSGVDADSPRQIPEDAPAPDGRTGSD